MKRIALLCALILACFSASAQYIKSDSTYVHGARSIVTTPCMHLAENYAAYLLNYTYVSDKGREVITLNIYCTNAGVWYLLDGTTARAKMADGTYSGLTLYKFENDDGVNVCQFYITTGRENHLAGITDIVFDTSFGEPETVIIHLDERCTKHLGRSMRELALLTVE